MRNSQAFQEISAELIARGRRMRFRAEGRSMHPTIRDGEAINIEPVAPATVKRGDILLYRGARGVMAHRVVAIRDVMGKGSGVRGFRSSILNHLSLRFRLSSIFHPQSSFFSSQSSVLITHHSFVLRGDAAVTSESVESGRVLGKVVSVERNGREIAVNSIIAKVTHYLLVSVLRLARLPGIKRIFHFTRRLLGPLVVRSG